MLEIKPILTINLGEVSPFKNTRRWTQAKAELLNTMEAMIKNPSDLTVFVGDSDMKDEGDNLREEIKKRFNPKN